MSVFRGMLQKDIPNVGVVGDVYYATDTKSLFICIGDGGLIPLQSLWAGNNTGEIGPTGPQGIQGVQGVGLSWSGSWEIGGTYPVNSLVSYLGNCYICISESAPGNLPTGPKWNLFAAKGSDGSAGSTGATGSTGPQGPSGASGPTLAQVAALSIALG